MVTKFPMHIDPGLEEEISELKKRIQQLESDMAELHKKFPVEPDVLGGGLR